MGNVGHIGIHDSPGNDIVTVGTWTPTIIGSSTAGTQTYSVQVGRYVKIGKLILAIGVVTITAKDAAIAGNVYVGGFPFIFSNTTNLLPTAIITGHGLTLTASYTWATIQAIPNTTTAEVAQQGSAQTIANVTVANLAAASTFRFQITYLTD